MKRLALSVCVIVSCLFLLTGCWNIREKSYYSDPDNFISDTATVEKIVYDSDEGILVLSLSKKIGKKLVVKTLKLLQKMRIVKNYEKQYERVMKVVSGYQGTMSEYAKDVGFFIVIVLISILINIIHYSIPFFIYLLFGGTNIALWPNMLVLAVMIELAASFIPLPGGTGMNEISFTVMFAPYFTGGTIFWALLLWRFMSYYIYLLQGIGVIIYDYAIGNKKYNWQKRKWELEAESKLFREQQIKNYKKQKKQSKKTSKV